MRSLSPPAPDLALPVPFTPGLSPAGGLAPALPSPHRGTAAGPRAPPGSRPCSLGVRGARELPGPCEAGPGEAAPSAAALCPAPHACWARRALP